MKNNPMLKDFYELTALEVYVYRVPLHRLRTIVTGEGVEAVSCR